MNQYAVILVLSTGHAIRLEHVLHQNGITSKLIPVPRYLSSNCGNCLRIERTDIDAAKKIIEKNKIEIEAIHDLD